MSEINDGGAAFPHGEIHDDFARPGAATCRHLHAEQGLTVRDFMAAKALQGLLAMESNPRFGTVCEPFRIFDPEHVKQMADNSYAMADAMLRARGGL